ncbi:hypothetical protein RB601_003086 [Gaeumannomyces tritici]
MHLASILGALAAGLTAAQGKTSGYFNNTADLAPLTTTTKALHWNFTSWPRRNSSVVTKHQTTLVTVSRAANSTLSRTWLNGTITGTTRSTNRTATFQWTPPTPTLPYRCAMRDCWRHPKDKDRQWCEQEDREKCKKEWESIQSEVWATSRLVNDAVGENARQTVKKMNSQEFKEWVSRMELTPGLIFKPTVSAYD